MKIDFISDFKNILLILLLLAIYWLISENKLLTKDFKKIQKKNIELDSKISECENKFN